MTLKFGASLAEKLTTRYEAYPLNDPREKRYDLRNNQTGRDFAELVRDDPNAEHRLALACKE